MRIEEFTELIRTVSDYTEQPHYVVKELPLEEVMDLYWEATDYEEVKAAQKEYIGHFQGANMHFDLEEEDEFLHIIKTCVDMDINPVAAISYRNKSIEDELKLHQDHPDEMQVWINEQMRLGRR